jgi:hypothetical protein
VIEGLCGTTNLGGDGLAKTLKSPFYCVHKFKSVMEF